MSQGFSALFFISQLSNSGLIGGAEEVVLVVKAYISYAIVVFAAYSGNSAVEKWLVRKYKDMEE